MLCIKHTSAGQPGAVCAARIDKRHLPHLLLYPRSLSRKEPISFPCEEDGRSAVALSAFGKDAELTRGILFIHTGQVCNQGGTVLWDVSHICLSESQLKFSFIMAGV